jgi:hypothetical protein
MIRTASVLAALLLMLGASAMADVYNEDFEGGTNSAGWTYGNSADVIEVSGGNPGYWLHNPNLDTFGPILRTDFYAANFTGNYRDMGVMNITFDGRTDVAAVPINMTVLLRSTNGTPANYDDDDYAYFPGEIIPQPGEGWLSYDFVVPSQSTDAVPAGWFGGWSGDLENFRPGIDWNDVITNVDRVEIWWWHPAYSGIFRSWDVGVDNITIIGEDVSPVEHSTWGSIKDLYK